MSAEEKKGDSSTLSTDVVRDEGLMPEVGAAAEPVEAAPTKKRMSDKMLYVGTSLLTQVMRIGTGLVMARMLTPADFGIVSLVLIVPGYISSLGDMGVSKSLVQFRDDDRAEIEDSSLLITLGIGGIVMIAMTIAGAYFWIERNDINLLAVGVLSGLTVVLGYVYQFQMACMNRDMKFRTEAYQNLIFSFTTMATGVGLAYSGFGLYAVVMQPLAAQVMANIAIFPKHPIRFPRAQTKSSIKKILRYGSGVTLAGYLGNLQVMFAYTIIGHRWGEAALGIFSKSTQMRDMAGQNIAAALDRMLYPLMRADRDKQERLRHLFLRGINSVALLCTFGWAALTAISPEIVHVVMGPKWDMVARLLRWLSPALFYLPLMVSSVAVANAMGNIKVWTWSSVLGLIGVATGMLIGQMWGFEGAIIGMTLGQSLWVVLCTHWAMKITKTRRRELAKRVLAISLAGVLSCAAMFAMRSVMMYDLLGQWTLDPSPVGIKVWRLLLNMFVVGVVGFAVYMGVNWTLSRNAIREMIDMVRRKG